jgi:hypothetical protein
MGSSRHSLDDTLVRKPMNVNEILSQLRSNEGHVAKDAVLEAAACREEIIPALLNVLRDVANNSEPYASDPKSMIFSHAVYLLAQFRESRAYPYLIQMNGEITGQRSQRSRLY